MHDSLDSLLTKISVNFQVNTAVAMHITKVRDVATLIAHKSMWINYVIKDH